MFKHQGFGNKAAVVMPFMRRDQDLLSSYTQLFPARSKRTPLLVKSELINGTSVAPKITYLEKGKKHCVAAVRERNELKNVRGTAL